MTEHEALVWLLTRGAAAVVGLYLLHRLLLWLESHGLVYYRNNKPKPGGVTNAALGLERIYQPTVEHRIEVDDAQVETAENDGD